MKISGTGNYFKRVTAVYLIDDTAGTARVQSKMLSLLVPILVEKELEEAFLIAQAKRVIAAEQDVGEEHICVFGVGSDVKRPQN